MASDALGSELVSRTVGYKITKGNFSNVTPNLPQRIAIIGEVNTANQSTYPTDPKQITSSQQAGDLYGYGSPIHIVSRILLPVFSNGVGGIPVVVYPQAEPGSAVAKVIDLTVTGTVTEAATHTVEICGRGSIDGENYNFDVSVGDTVTTIAEAIRDVINNNTYSPVTATSTLGVVTITSKWAGLTSDDIEVTVNKNEKEIGVTYASASTTSGAGTPTVTTSLNSFGEEWNTILVNTYGVTSTTLLDELEDFNGIPDPDSPTGRYAGQIVKPFIAFTGSTDDENTTLTNTDARRQEVTLAICPAPRSSGLPMEAAANMCVLEARIAQDTPHLDSAGRYYPDMPTPNDIGPMATYVNRDTYVKKGNSTVNLVNGRYQVQDFVTTYHPTGETVPQFRYVRNLMLDFNIKFGYFLLEETYVVDHSISSDNDVVQAAKVVKPKTWTSVLFGYADDLSLRGLIVEPQFMKNSIEVSLSTTNPDRLETFFRYKRSGFVRLSATTAEAGFNFGTL